MSESHADHETCTDHEARTDPESHTDHASRTDHESRTDDEARTDHEARPRADRRAIRVSALVLRRGAAILMVRKRGTTAYMLPGGKPEPGEAPIDTIIREVEEELGLPVAAEDLKELGTFEAPAANESDHVVIGDVFVHRGMPAGFDFDGIRVKAEIDSLAWFVPEALPDDTAALTIAPLTRAQVIPALARVERATEGPQKTVT